MEELWEEHESGYYIPHHGVITAEKFRVVFNGSMKTTSGISLNETQLVGEKLQPDLFITLMNFRKYKYGITADIEKMYRQVLVHESDKQYQKILWRPNEQTPVKVYKLNTVTYGQACAPHCAIRALLQCAIDNEQNFPRGASIVRSSFYVDDLLTGANTLEEVEQIKIEITRLLSLGGFHITKWKTNGEFFEKLEFKNEEEHSVLGLCWDLKNDSFFYKIREGDTPNDPVWTKRKVLSRIGQMYDPNGFLGPVILKGKMIIQELWKDQLSWDQPIEGKIKEKWEAFNED